MAGSSPDALLLGSVVPFTLLVIWPTNKAPLDPTLAAETPEAVDLAGSWGRLHAVRSLVSTVAFVLLLLGLAAR